MCALVKENSRSLVNFMVVDYVFKKLSFVLLWLGQGVDLDQAGDTLTGSLIAFLILSG